ncbi:MAG TPA: hypothetical protein VIY48_14905, partial [Candidatus Paceibacterota bacterium]
RSDHTDQATGGTLSAAGSLVPWADYAMLVAFIALTGFQSSSFILSRGKSSQVSQLARLKV